MHKLSNNLQAIIWMVISCFWFSLLSAIIRHLSETLNPYVIVSLRNLFAIVLILLWIVIKDRGHFSFPRTKIAKLHNYRAIAGMLSMFLWVYGISVIPLTQAVALDYTAPLFTVLLAVIFLKEKLNNTQLVALFIGFVGAMIIIRPGTDDFHIGAIASLAANFLYAVSVIFYKKIIVDEDNITTVFFTWLFMFFFCIPFMVYYWQTPSLNDVLWLILAAQVSNFLFIAIANAFRKVDLAVVMPFEFTALIFTTFLAYFIFDEIINKWTIIGAIIVLSGTSIALHKEMKRRDQTFT